MPPCKESYDLPAAPPCAVTATTAAGTTIRKDMTSDASGRSDEPRFVDATEAARILQVHVRTIRREAAAGRIPAVRVGREWRFLLDDLRQLTHRKPDQGPS